MEKKLLLSIFFLLINALCAGQKQTKMGTVYAQSSLQDTMAKTHLKFTAFDGSGICSIVKKDEGFLCTVGTAQFIPTMHAVDIKRFFRNNDASKRKHYFNSRYIQLEDRYGCYSNSMKFQELWVLSALLYFVQNAEREQLSPIEEASLRIVLSE